MTKKIKRFERATDIVTHIERGRVDPDDKLMLALAARRLLSGYEVTPHQSTIWAKYGNEVLNRVRQ